MFEPIITGKDIGQCVGRILVGVGPNCLLDEICHLPKICALGNLDQGSTKKKAILQTNVTKRTQHLVN